MTSTTQFNASQLTSRIATLVEVLTQFSEVLQQESALIKTSDTEALIKNNALKESLALQLSQVGTQVEQSLAPLNTTLIDFIDTTEFIKLSIVQQQSIQQAIDLSIHCHDKNLANGMSIQMLSNINQHALDITTGQDKKQVKLYSASGEKTKSSGQTSLGKA